MKSDGEAKAATEVHHFPVHIAADAPWYEAHFPGQPIVPGAVLLAAVESAWRDASSQRGVQLGVLTAVRHLRFLQPVRAPITLQASIHTKNEWLHCSLVASSGGDVLRAQLQFGA